MFFAVRFCSLFATHHVTLRAPPPPRFSPVFRHACRPSDTSVGRELPTVNGTYDLRIARFRALKTKKKSPFLHLLNGRLAYERPSPRENFSPVTPGSNPWPRAPVRTWWGAINSVLKTNFGIAGLRRNRRKTSSGDGSVPSCERERRLTGRYLSYDASLFPKYYERYRTRNEDAVRACFGTSKTDIGPSSCDSWSERARR